MYATRGGRGVRYARTIVNARHVSEARMQLPCAHHVPHYTVQALRARGKRAVSLLTSRFRVASYCRRVDLVCDKSGIGGGSKHYDDNDARPDRIGGCDKHCDTTTMHSPTAFHTARPHQHLGRQEAAAYATRGGCGLRYARTIVNAHHVS